MFGTGKNNKNHTNRDVMDKRFEMRVNDHMLDFIDSYAQKHHCTRSAAAWDLIQKGKKYEEAVNKL